MPPKRSKCEECSLINGRRSRRGFSRIPTSRGRRLGGLPDGQRNVDTEEETAPGSERRRLHADAGSVAEQVHVVGHVDHGGTQSYVPKMRNSHAFFQPEVRLDVVREMFAVTKPLRRPLPASVVAL